MRIISNQELLHIAGGSEGEESIDGDFNDYAFIDGGSGGKTKGGGGGGAVNTGTGSSDNGSGKTVSGGGTATAGPNGATANCGQGELPIASWSTGASAAAVSGTAGGGNKVVNGNVSASKEFANNGVYAYAACIEAKTGK